MSQTRTRSCPNCGARLVALRENRQDLLGCRRCGRQFQTSSSVASSAGSRPSKPQADVAERKVRARCCGCEATVEGPARVFARPQSCPKCKQKNAFEILPEEAEEDASSLRAEVLGGSQSYEVRVSAWKGVSATDTGLHGDGTLVVTAEGLGLKRSMGGEQKLIAWEDVRDLHNYLPTRLSFWGDFGNEEQVCGLEIKVAAGDVDALSRVLDSVLPDAGRPRCQECGGRVKKDICTSCGANLSVTVRSQGGVQVGLGLLMIVVGGAITLFSYNNAEPGGRYSIFYGLIIAGVFALGRGLVKLAGGSSAR